MIKTCICLIVDLNSLSTPEDIDSEITSRLCEGKSSLGKYVVFREAHVKLVQGLVSCLVITFFSWICPFRLDQDIDS